MKKILCMFLLLVASQVEAQEVISVSYASPTNEKRELDDIFKQYVVSDTFIVHMNRALAKNFPATFHSLSVELKQNEFDEVVLTYSAIVVPTDSSEAIVSMTHRGAFGSSDLVYAVEDVVLRKAKEYTSTISKEYEKRRLDYQNFADFITAKNGVLYVVADNFFVAEYVPKKSLHNN